MRIEIRTALAATDPLAGQRILEDLFETQEFHNGKRHGFMEAQTTLIRPERRIELDTISTVHTDLVLIVFPGHTEHNLALWFNYAGQDCGVTVVFTCHEQRFNSFDNLAYSLLEFRLGWVTA